MNFSSPPLLTRCFWIIYRNNECKKFALSFIRRLEHSALSRAKIRHHQLLPFIRWKKDSLFERILHFFLANKHITFSINSKQALFYARAKSSPRARQKIFCADSCAVRVYFFFIAPVKCRQLKKKLSPAFMHARTILLIQIKKSLATDAIYCCSLFKHLTLFAGRTRKRNLCQREQFESKSLRAQYVSHLFIQAARQPP
jgi:hypothetical protein